MAFEQGIARDVSAPAGEDLSGDQYKGVNLEAGGDVKASTVGAGAAVFGVLQNNPGINAEATVRRSGATKMVAGVGGLAVGDLVTVEALGAGVTAGAADVVVGFCRVAAAAGEVATVDIGYNGAA